MYNLGFLYYYDKKDSAAALDIWKRWLALHPNAPAAGDVSKQIAQIENEISHRLGFAVKSQRLQITASCEEFKRRGSCHKKCA